VHGLDGVSGGRAAGADHATDDGCNDGIMPGVGYPAKTDVSQSQPPAAFGDEEHGKGGSGPAVTSRRRR